MSSMRTLITLSLALFGTQAATLGSADNQLRTFASCAGRLSAQMEWQWMFDGDASDRTKAQRAAMLSLLDATMSPEQGRDVLAWRIDAKVAHAALLTRASFAQDTADAEWAQDAAGQQIAQCTSLLLG